MTKVLILGANGQIARLVARALREDGSAKMTLFLRDATRALATAGDGTRVYEGDVLDPIMLEAAMDGQDLVYASLSGAVDRQAEAILAAMARTGVGRLIFGSAMGVHDEVPGMSLGSGFAPHRRAAALIEEAGIAHTLLRPAWLSDAEEIAYGVTHREDGFGNPDEPVSRRSVADLAARLCLNPDRAVRQSLGIHRATDPARPSCTIGGCEAADPGMPHGAAVKTSLEAGRKAHHRS
ncbi:NAD(P)H-binding protein [Poseidonocella sp. HB161398]|uniref:NAD(P)H-binding protein n=1 Tax=Poseidonocella sp. HB161398 TaxID=2320855 RepID=UPI0011093D4B|nr:NAD(P)H-binding protein [Poseidonocella sp. HB161398]